MSPSGGDWQPLGMLRQLNMPNESWPGPDTASELPEMLTEREACAKLLEFTNSGVRLVAGEISPDVRTVRQHSEPRRARLPATLRSRHRKFQRVHHVARGTSQPLHGQVDEGPGA